VICYLGSVDESNCTELWLRVDFRDAIDAKVDQLDFTHRERAKIENQFAGSTATRVYLLLPNWHYKVIIS